MRILFINILLMGTIGLPNVAKAGSYCDTLTKVSRVENASEDFLSAPTHAGRSAAIAGMSRELRNIDGTDFSQPVFDDVRNFLVTFVQSRRHIVQQAENTGIGSALVTARTSSYTDLAWAFDSIHRPTKCDRQVKSLATDGQGGNEYTGSGGRQMSNHHSFDFPASVLALLAFALAGAGPVGHRFLKKRKEIERRRSKRFNCLIDITIRKDGFQYDASIHDLSRLGCKMKWKQQIEIGKRIEVQLGDIQRHGRIIWSNRHYKGVEFDKDLSSKEMKDAIGID